MRRLLPASIASASFLLGCGRPAPADGSLPTADAVRARLDRSLPALMEEFGVPGVAIAVVGASGPIVLATYGYADAPDSPPIDRTTVFEAASLGKPLFGYALLRHTDAPAFDLDRPIEDYLDTRLTADSLGAEITARQLLSHSSGLAFSDADQKRHVLFRPSSAWRYSGLGYAALQKAAETFWHRSLDDIVRETATGPLEMRSTSYVPPDDRSSMTPGHDRQGRRMASTTWSSPSAASSLHTTVGDYGRFVSAILAALAGGDAGPVTRMVEPQVEVDDALGLSWGLGWAVARDGDETVFLHWGSNPGYKSLALGSVGRGIGMVVLTNGDNGLEVATALVPLVFDRDYPFLRFYMLHPDD